MSDLWEYNVEDDHISSDEDDEVSDRKRKANDSDCHLDVFLAPEKRSKLRKRYGHDIDSSREGSRVPSPNAGAAAIDLAGANSDSDEELVRKAACDAQQRVNADDLLHHHLPQSGGASRAAQAEIASSKLLLQRVKARLQARAKAIDSDDEDAEQEADGKSKGAPSPLELRRFKGTAASAPPIEPAEPQDSKAGDTPAKGEVATVHVRLVDSHGHALQARLRMDKGFKRVKKKYLEHARLESWLPRPDSRIKLVFDGDEVGDTDTPESLGLEEDDSLDVWYISPS